MVRWTKGKKLVGGFWIEDENPPVLKKDYKNKTKLFKTLKEGKK